MFDGKWWILMLNCRNGRKIHLNSHINQTCVFHIHEWFITDFLNIWIIAVTWVDFAGQSGSLKIWQTVSAFLAASSSSSLAPYSQSSRTFWHIWAIDCKKTKNSDFNFDFLAASPSSSSLSVLGALSGIFHRWTACCLWRRKKRCQQNSPKWKGHLAPVKAGLQCLLYEWTELQFDNCAMNKLTMYLL